MSSGPVSPTAAWPLTGRDTELDAIAAMRADRDCHGVVITASAGSGKSRLAREAVSSAERAGAVVEWIQATRSAAAVPLGAVAGLLPERVRSDDTLALMRSSAEALQARGRGKRVVLGVDDAQRLDPVSAALVLHVVANADVFVIATVRTGESRPDAVDALWKDAGARRVELGRLDDDAVAALVERALGSAVETATLQWVIEAGQGNPLYVRELVLGALDTGTLRHEDGLWRLAGRPAISPSLVDVVSQRLAGLDAEQRTPLELLALAEPLRLPELAALTSYDALTEAEARGLVTIDSAGPDAELRLAHPLFGDVVGSGLSGLRARRLRLALAEQLQRRDPLTSQDARRIARLLFDAGAEIPSALLLDAARGASLGGDADLTHRLATRSLAEGGGLQAAILLARADLLRNRPQDAATTLADAEPLAPGSPAADEYLRLRVRIEYWTLRRPAEADALLQRAAGWSDGPEWRETVRRQSVVQQRLDGNLVEGDAVEVDDDPHLQRLRALMLLFSGRPDEAYRVSLRFRPSVPYLHEGEAGTEGVLILAALLGGADLPGFERSVRHTFAEAVRVNDDQAAGLAAFAVAAVLIWGGAHEDSRRWCAEAATHLRKHDLFGTIVMVRALEVYNARFTGGDIQATIARMHEAIGGRELLPTQRPYVLLAEGYGDPSGRRMLESARTLADQPAYACEIAYEAMLAGAPGAIEAVLEFARRCVGRLMSAYAAHAAARRDRDAQALLAVADTFVAIGAPPYAVEAAVEAAGVFAAAGDIDAARRAAARARELHVPGEGVELPHVPGLETVVVELTGRESQLIELVRAGLSNAEIADRLVLSVRTVESHLYRAMRKLGVSDRRDL